MNLYQNVYFVSKGHLNCPVPYKTTDVTWTTTLFSVTPEPIYNDPMFFFKPDSTIPPKLTTTQVVVTDLFLVLRLSPKTRGHWIAQGMRQSDACETLYPIRRHFLTVPTRLT